MSTVPNAIPGRDSIEVEIFGMEGIPEEDRIAHERTKTGKFSPRPLYFGKLPVHTEPATYVHVPHITLYI